MGELARPEKQGAKRSFSRAASRYDEIAMLQKEVGNNLLARLPSENLREKRILDVGAGTGFCSTKLASMTNEVIVLDISTGMLNEAKNNVPGTARIICGDAEALPLRSESIDVIFSNLALQWCVNLDALFSDLYRVLKPGGLLLFSSFGPSTLHELKLAWESVDQNSHVNEFYSVSDLSLKMCRYGFSSPTIEVETKKIQYASAMSLMGELKGIGAGNVTRGRFRGMTGKAKLLQVIKRYEEIGVEQEILATFELLYGRALKPK
ncbi:MAG: malonyl-ACP O-methyltransferase BioC [Methylococcales bacterium]